MVHCFWAKGRLLLRGQMLRDEHILPTKRAARYTGGLNVMKFPKVLTWQERKQQPHIQCCRVAH